MNLGTISLFLVAVNIKQVHQTDVSLEICEDAIVNRNQQYYDFVEFIKSFNKKYRSKVECQKRFELFKKSFDESRRLQNEEKGTAKYGTTFLSDLTEEELNNYLTQATGMSQPREVIQVDSQVRLPRRFDWRAYHVVNDVINQTQCFASYAASAVANVEGTYAVKHKQLYKLSEQQIIDCDQNNAGCRLGWPKRAMKYLTHNGAVLNSDYPYVNKQRSCNYDRSRVVITPNSTVSLPRSEDAIVQYLYEHGPLSAGMCGSILRNYKSGIIYSPSCCTDYTLSVTLVGFGREIYQNRRKLLYWVARNSWGSDFGEKGYFRIARNKRMCGINRLVDSVVF